MKYVAHVLIKIDDIREFTDASKEWTIITNINNKEYLFKIDNNYLEVISCYFDSQEDALQEAKKMYVSLIVYLLKYNIQISNVNCEFYGNCLFEPDDYTLENIYRTYTRNYSGCSYGPNVYEVNESYKEMTNELLECEILYDDEGIVKVINKSLDNRSVVYNDEIREYLFDIIIADNIQIDGIKYNIYCSILESFAIEEKKDKTVISTIDELKEIVSNKDIDNNIKNELYNFLENGKNLSARRKCTKVCGKYAKDKYGEYSTNKILSEAYSLRSKYTHYHLNDKKSKVAKLIKYVVLDVVINYFNNNSD